MLQGSPENTGGGTAALPAAPPAPPAPALGAAAPASDGFALSEPEVLSSGPGMPSAHPSAASHIAMTAQDNPAHSRSRSADIL